MSEEVKKKIAAPSGEKPVSLGPWLGLGSAIVIGIAIRWGGLPAGFLVGAAMALSAVIALVWNGLGALVSGTSSMSLDEALHLAAPTRAEEQKRAILRTLKDLEYELSVGKISPEDFAKVSAEFREEARRMISLADASLDERRRAAEARIAALRETESKTESSSEEV